MWWPALGAIVVGIGGLIDAHVLGAGYQSIQDLLNGSLATRVVLALFVVKAVVWLVALGSGTSGGVLAPLLILGGACASMIGLIVGVNPGFCAMLGMAGILSGAMRAPLTGAVFAAELTGHFDSLPAVFAASVCAYAVSVLIMRRSILTEKISRRGRHILQEYSVDPFDFLQAGHIMTPMPETLSGSTTIGETIAFFGSAAKHRSYPVIDEEGQLLGLVSRSDVLRWQVENGQRDAALSDVVSDASQPFTTTQAPVGIVADLMVETGVGRIPIVDPATRRVIGILSRHDLLKARRIGIEAERTRSR